VAHVVTEIRGNLRGRRRGRHQALRGRDEQPHGVADGLEALACGIEERARPVPIPVRRAVDLHPGLVEIDERTQRARTLFIEDGARALEPLVRLAGANDGVGRSRQPCVEGHGSSCTLRAPSLSRCRRLEPA